MFLFRKYLAGFIAFLTAVWQVVDVIKYVRFIDFNRLPNFEVGNMEWIVLKQASNLTFVPFRNFDPQPFIIAIGSFKGRFDEDGFFWSQACLDDFFNAGGC